jgi:hypothetical protein
MNGVFIVPQENGAVIAAYKSNPTFGYIKVQSSELQMDGGWLRTKKRSCLIKAELEVLKGFVSMYGTNKPIGGRIVVQECLESQIPSHLESKISKKMDRETALADFIKINPTTQDVLCSQGVRILRFVDWDQTGKLTDTFVQHDSGGSPDLVVADTAGITTVDDDAAKAGDDADLPF